MTVGVNIRKIQIHQTQITLLLLMISTPAMKVTVIFPMGPLMLNALVILILDLFVVLMASPMPVPAELLARRFQLLPMVSADFITLKYLPRKLVNVQ